MIRFLMLLLNICHFAKEYGLHVIKQQQRTLKTFYIRCVFLLALCMVVASSVPT